MQRLGLSTADLRTFQRGLATTHERRIEIDVLDLDGNHVTSLTDMFEDGELTVDVKRTPTRIATLRFLDPSESLQFEPDSPGDAPIHRRRQIRVTYAVRVAGLDDWVEIVVIEGPVWDFDRQGARVELTVDGKERHALGEAWKPVQFKKKTRKTDAIRELLSLAGETRLGGIPDLDVTMPERMTVLRRDALWPRCKRLAASMDRQLFYNGNGDVILRRIPSRPVFTFDERHLLTPVSIDRDPEGVFNTFVVVGAKPKGSKTRVRAIERLPASHPLSARSLGRGGELHYLVQHEENRQIKTKAEARARAERLRDDAMKVLVNYSFDTIPIPHLDENDLVRVKTDEGTFRVRMQSWSLPLGIEGSPAMTVNDVRRKIATKKGGW